VGRAGCSLALGGTLEVETTQIDRHQFPNFLSEGGHVRGQTVHDIERRSNLDTGGFIRGTAEVGASGGAKASVGPVEAGICVNGGGSGSAQGTLGGFTVAGH
jgi:hypothetical protein